MVSVLTSLTIATRAWADRRVPAALALFAIGFLAPGGPIGSHLGGWLAGGALLGAGLVAAYASLIRADVTIVPIALGTMMVIGLLVRGAQRPFPGALAGAIAGAAIVAAVSWWVFNTLRRWRAAAYSTT
jgi:hypothetical protein